MRHVDSVQLNSAYPGKKAFLQVVASDDDDEETDMAGTELLNNLNLINSKGVRAREGPGAKHGHNTGLGQTNHKTYLLYHDSSDCSQYRTIFQLIQILKNKTRPHLTMLCPNSTLLTLCCCMALGKGHK